MSLTAYRRQCIAQAVLSCGCTGTAVPQRVQLTEEVDAHRCQCSFRLTVFRRFLSQYKLRAKRTETHRKKHLLKNEQKSKCGNYV